MMQNTTKTYKKFTGGHTKSVNNMEVVHGLSNYVEGKQLWRKLHMHIIA